MMFGEAGNASSVSDFERCAESEGGLPYSREEEELLAFLRSERDSYYRGDFDAFVEHWHHGPEVRRILSGPKTGTRIHVGWEQLLERFKEGFRQFPQNFDASKLLRWDNMQIQICGDMAWASYDQIANELPDGMHADPFTHEIKIAQRFNGSWKLVCLTVVAPEIEREDAPRIELDMEGKVVRVNGIARERLIPHSGLTLSGDRPRAKNRRFDKGLQEAIMSARKILQTNLPRGFLDEQVQAVPLGEDVAGYPIFCWVMPEQERVLISFDDLYLLRSRLEIAVSTFGLSPAQLNIAQQLASGRDLAGVANELAVSINTVRTQLRRMFEKTNTHNQAALVSRLLNVQGPL